VGLQNENILTLPLQVAVLGVGVVTLRRRYRSCGELGRALGLSQCAERPTEIDGFLRTTPPFLGTVGPFLGATATDVVVFVHLPIDVLRNK